MIHSRTRWGVLCCAVLAAGLAGCNTTPVVTAADQPPAAPRSLGLVAGDAIGRFTYAEDARIAWAPDLPWMASYHSVVEQHRRTATVRVDPDTQ